LSASARDYPLTEETAMQGLRSHLTYANVMSTLAALFALSGGVAYAANTIASSDVIDESLQSRDIKNGEVKIADIGQGAVATDELANGQVKAADIGDGEVKSAEIANGQVQTAEIGANQVRGSHLLDATLTGADVADNALKGADIDENTLDIGNAARAYARVPAGCSSAGGCLIDRSKGISSVTRISEGRWCVVAPGIDPLVTPAVVSVDWNTTSSPEGNASAMVAPTTECEGEGFVVFTYFGPDIEAFDTAGNTRTVRGSSTFSDSVGFTIVIP
jgi:hypothetical protein